MEALQQQEPSYFEPQTTVLWLMLMGSSCRHVAVVGASEKLSGKAKVSGSVCRPATHLASILVAVHNLWHRETPPRDLLGLFLGCCQQLLEGLMLRLQHQARIHSHTHT